MSEWKKVSSCCVSNVLYCMSPAGKDKKGCPTLPRMEQDTCHTLFAEDKKSVEYYFASDARSDSSLFYFIVVISHSYIVRFILEYPPNQSRQLFGQGLLLGKWE